MAYSLLHDFKIALGQTEYTIHTAGQALYFSLLSAYCYQIYRTFSIGLAIILPTNSTFSGHSCLDTYTATSMCMCVHVYMCIIMVYSNIFALLFSVYANAIRLIFCCLPCGNAGGKTRQVRRLSLRLAIHISRYGLVFISVIWMSFRSWPRIAILLIIINSYVGYFRFNSKKTY